MKESIVVIATLPPVAGGSLRSLRFVNECSRYFDVGLFLPYGATGHQIPLEFLRNLVRTITGFKRIKLPKTRGFIELVTIVSIQLEPNEIETMLGTLTVLHTTKISKALN